MYYSSGQAVTVDLATGTGRGGEAEGDRYSSVEAVQGSQYADRITGNAAANLIRGTGGADVLAGGGGADRFFIDGSDGSSATAPDRILDFSHAQADKIVTDDANDDVDGFQAFQFIGKSGFTGVGQLRWYQQNGDTIVEGNTSSATPGAELKLVLDPLVSLQTSDFIFAEIGFAPVIQA
jgi:Ca2+-binding RTX toxin-like protein